MTKLALAEAVPLAHALVSRAARDADVRTLFIKGPCAFEQGLRSRERSLDVDVLVDPAGLETLRDHLSGLGWVDEHPYSTPTAATYSRTHRHSSWPCELDLHTTFPGLYAAPQEVFEQLWVRRATVWLAGQNIDCPDVPGHAVILALNSLRDPYDPTKAVELQDLVERVGCRLDVGGIDVLGRLAGRIGAADTAAPFLSAVGAPNDARGSTPESDMHAWQLRTQPAWRVATWIEGLRQERIHRWPSYLWRAVMLSEAEVRIADPTLPDGRLPLLRARLRRLRRGLRTMPVAVRSVRALRHDRRDLS